MIFVIDKLKYDTDKMELISENANITILDIFLGEMSYIAPNPQNCIRLKKDIGF